jgi:O-antigen/teichoic acid export membrane protein
VVRTLGVAQFGAFSLAYVTYGFAINASRGLSIEPLLVRFSGTDAATWRRAAAGCTGTALLVGIVGGACLVVAGLLIGGTTGLALDALGLTLPGLLLQDSWRYSFFALGRGHHAFINDSIWAAVQIPLLVLVNMSGRSNVFWLVLAWGVAATVGGAVAPLQALVMPNLAGAKAWLVTHRDLGPRYLAENTGGNASDMLRSYSVSFILGVAAVGYIQAAGVLMGPFRILYTGMGLILMPEAARLLRRAPQRLPVFCLAVSGGLGLLALLWGLVLLVALPHGLGHLMLGSKTWRPTYPLVIPATVAMVSSCANAGALVGLHALGAARRSLRAVIVSSALIVVLVPVGALAGRTLGTMWFYAAASWAGSMVIWWQLRQGLRESRTEPDAPEPAAANRPGRSAGSHRRSAVD